MAHSTIDSPLAETTYRISGEHSFRFSKAELRKFQRSIDVLRHALYQDMPINMAEFLIIENYMLLLEKAYLRWRRHHGGPNGHD
jgi:hypothetical protein